VSTGADCQFKEVTPGRWSYALQEWPYGDSNEYTSYGPFASFAIARDHLDQNHANPGGWMTTIHPTGHVHEWTTDRGAYVPAGVVVTIRVESLGQDPTPEALLKLITKKGALTTDHLSIRPETRYDMNAKVTSCESCNQQKP